MQEMYLKIYDQLLRTSELFLSVYNPLPYYSYSSFDDW